MVDAPRRIGLARVLSKRGLCSRTQASEWIRAGRVQVDGRVVRDPEFPVARGTEAGIAMDRRLLAAATRRLAAAGCRVWRHRAVPPNDAGIALGQLAVAAARQRV